jgi:membrane peptidoglycan carboxypeptidase
MLNGPSYYNPKRHEDRARERRNLVMRRMQEAGAITEAEYLKLSATKIKLNFHFHRPEIICRNVPFSVESGKILPSIHSICP